MDKPKIPPCTGYWTSTSDGNEFDCDYQHPPTCEECIINFKTLGGLIDPRTGKRIAGYRALKAPGRKD